MLPPGELIYMLMSLVASSLWRYSSCATVTLAIWSSIGVPIKMIRSFNRREKMSQPRSPRGVDSTTLGIIPLGSRISALPFIHFGSLGLKTAPILAPSSLSKTTNGQSLSPVYIGRVVPLAKTKCAEDSRFCGNLYRYDSTCEIQTQEL